MQTSWRATRRTIPNVSGPMLRIAHLYADEMNIYGDRGNILTLVKRAEWRGHSVRDVGIRARAAPHPSRLELVFLGGGPGPGHEMGFQAAAEAQGGASRGATPAGAA